MSNFYDFSAKNLHGEEISMSTYRGKALLVVNTASKCGLTQQLSGLEELYQAYQDGGLVILGFPCNQFGKQEPGTSAEISEFCHLNYGVTFPIFAKVEVNGPNAHPLWHWLQSQQSGFMGNKIKWNFTKFLVNQKGEVVSRFAPTTSPNKLISAIEELLD